MSFNDHSDDDSIHKKCDEKIVDLKKVIKSQKREIKELTEYKKDADEEIIELKDDCRRIEDKLKNKIKRKQKEIEDLSTKVEEVKEKSHVKELMTKWKSQSERKNTKINKQTEEITESNSLLNSEKYNESFEIENLTNKLKELEKEIGRLKEEIEKQQQNSAVIISEMEEELEENNLKYTKEIKQLKKELEEEREKNEELEDQLKNNKKVCKDLKKSESKLTELEEENRKKCEEIEEKEREIKIKNQKLDTMKAENDELQNNYRMLQDQNKQFQSRAKDNAIGAIKNKLNVKEKETRELKDKIVGMSAEMEQYKRDLMYEKQNSMKLSNDFENRKTYFEKKIKNMENEIQQIRVKKFRNEIENAPNNNGAGFNNEQNYGLPLWRVKHKEDHTNERRPLVQCRNCGEHIPITEIAQHGQMCDQLLNNRYD